VEGETEPPPGSHKRIGGIGGGGEGGGGGQRREGARKQNRECGKVTACDHKSEGGGTPSRKSKQERKREGRT